MHVAWVDISQLDQREYERLYAQASAPRQSRADRCLRREDKYRCVTADALVRYAAERELGLSDFTVAQDPLGKPYLAETENFHFNLSHSGSRVAIAYGSTPVGIDVQQMRGDVEKEKIVRRYFTAAEQDYVFGGEDRTERFFQVWTAKESYLKYLGTGLRQPLDSFSVVPDGAHLGVRLSSTFSDGYCLSLCTLDSNTTVTQLPLEELMGPDRKGQSQNDR